MIRGQQKTLKLTCLVLLLGMSTSVLAVFVDLDSVDTQLNGHAVANMQIGGQSVVTESGPMELNFIAGLRNNAPLVLDVLIEEEDRRPYIAFSANLINLTGEPLDVLILELSGAATFDNAVNLSASGLVQKDPSGQVITMTFDSPITHGASLGIGSPDAIPTFDDWLIYLNSLMAGDRFTLTIWTGDSTRSLLQANAIPGARRSFVVSHGVRPVPSARQNLKFF